MAKLIDADALETKFRKTKIIEVFPEWDRLRMETKRELIKFGKAVKEIVTTSPAVDAVPVSELLELRDWLYEHDSISMNGLWRLNNLISKYKKDGGGNE